jgi:hypothetical protein
MYTRKETQYPFYTLGVSQDRPGWVRKISPQPEFQPWTVQAITSRYAEYATMADKQSSRRPNRPALVNVTSTNWEC